VFLSRLILNPRSRRAQQERADLYQLHRTVMRAFPEVLPSDERVLFRLEDDQLANGLIVLVQSHYPPNWNWLEAESAVGYLLPTADPNPWVKSFEPVFFVGQRFIFRLRANPTVKRDGKRVALLRETEQLQWLERKAATGGFALDSVRIQCRGYAQGMTRERQWLKLSDIQYDGSLQVTDTGLFWSSVADGVGSAKGFGFGLLSLAPVN